MCVHWLEVFGIIVPTLRIFPSQVRFSSPVMLSDTLRVRAWRDGPGRVLCEAGLLTQGGQGGPPGPIGRLIPKGSHRNLPIEYARGLTEVTLTEVRFGIRFSGARVSLNPYWNS